MLNIITGRTGSGKTLYIRQLAANIAEKESGRAILIVPEQFSFETEKAMLSLLGNRKINNIEILSFSRLCERLLSAYGKIGDKPADNGTRAVLMSLAIDSLQDKINMFSRYRKSPRLISDLLSFYAEMRRCCITNEQLSELSTKVKKQTFSNKLQELSLIFNCYEALLSQGFQDDCIYPDLLYDLLGEVNYFKNKVVFLDAFTLFDKQKCKILERIIGTAQETYVTFSCDINKNNDRYELFYNAQNEIKKLKSIANRQGIKIAPVTVLHPKKEYKAEPLNVLEEQLFNLSGEKYGGECSCISLMPRYTKADECDSVAAEIKRLAREEGYRYREIAVIERTEGAYKNELVSSFRKYGVDYFEDNRQPIVTQPLMVFVLALFDIIVDGLKTETVLRFLKTGLYGFSVEDIALIEDYALVWRITPSQWKNQWKENPRGFGEALNEQDEENLARLNSLRERIVGPILALKGRMTDTDGKTIAKELFAFLRNLGIDNNLKLFTEQLLENHENDLALEQGRIWRMLAEIIDSLYYATGDTSVSVARFKELFEILVSTKDLGEIPSGIDEVIIGNAERIRAFSPRAVFVMGANTGVFPKEFGGGVLLNDMERCELKENGAEITSNLEYNSVNEKFITYHALTLATDRLYVSYSAVDNDSTPLTPSEIVDEIKRIFPSCNVINEDKMALIESRRSAYSTYASEQKSPSELGVTLYEYFDKNGTYSEKAMLKKIGKRNYQISSENVATELFGKSMYVSASRVERFYKCPFSYFCEYGIKAKPRREAQMDPAQTGTLIHYVLEVFLKENPKATLESVSKDTVCEKIAEIVDGYVNDRLGGYTDKNASFLRTMELLKDNAVKIAMQLLDEFSHSSFEPVDFELSINNDGAVAPYKIDLENGENVKIVGSVDRVDAYKTQENTFIRIIDYKTGGKDFKLDEVFSGINMQMLIYLFAIWQNGGELYPNVLPAGILYFQAKSPRIKKGDLTRYASESDAKTQMRKDVKMSGMVLNSVEVIDAMEHEGVGVFIPARLDKSGNPTGNVISLKSLELLRERVNGNIRNMALSLQQGKIDAFPVENGCKYCKFRDVCKREEDDSIREIEKFGFSDALERLAGDENE